MHPGKDRARQDNMRVRNSDIIPWRVFVLLFGSTPGRDDTLMRAGRLAKKRERIDIEILSLQLWPGIALYTGNGVIKNAKGSMK